MRVLHAIVVWLLLAMPAVSQQSVQPQVLIIDSDRIFFETLYGRRLARDFAAQAAEVQSENDSIVETLTEEEQSLTVRRSEMTPEAFRAEADVFDEKVQEVRRARDAKNTELQAVTANARALFEERIQGIVANVMLERGATMVLEQRNVVLSVRSANITDDVIVRIDATLGEGTQ